MLRLRDFRGYRRLGMPMAAIGLFVPVTALLGWAIGVPFLYRFGLPYSFWPMAALGHALLGGAQALAFSGRRRWGVPLLALPILIGLLSILEYAVGRSIGIDTLLFRSTLESMGVPQAGRVAVLSAVAMIAISVATLLALYGGRRWEVLVFGLCAIVMGFGWLSAGLQFAGFGAEVAMQPVRLASALPAAVAMVILACLPFAYRAIADPAGLFGINQPSGDAIRIGLPILLILPAGLLPIEHALTGNGFTTPFTAYVIALAGELVIGVVLIGLGVTRIARDKEALSESEARLEHALEAHRIGLFDWETTTNKLRWSPGAEERLGVEVGAMNDFANWAELVPKHEAAQVMASIADAAERNADRYSFAYHIRRADGEMRAIEGSGRCFYDKKGALQRVTGVNMDVTERVRHEAELARREAQWLLILTTVPDAMIVIDQTGNVMTFSAAAERLFGYAAEEVVGKSALMLLPETDAQVASAQLQLGINPAREHQSAAERIFTAQCKDGTQIPVEYSVGQATVDGQPIYTAFIRDISDRQDAERRFIALQHEYAHSARLNAVGELASGLAHELNQPLAAGANFLGVAEMMLEDKEGMEVVVEMIAEANGQMQRAGEIIRRLRDFIAKTDIDMRVEPLDETLREAVALGLSGARKQQIEISYAIAPGAETIFADRIQIQQVVVNIVRNAAEALRIMPPERRRIAIAARPIDTEMLEISITDRGPGLPQEMLDALFEPFRSTKQGAGLGIGLSICRRIVEAHGGLFSATNVDGGARFSFTLPRVSEEDEVGDACVTSMS